MVPIDISSTTCSDVQKVSTRNTILPSIVVPIDHDIDAQLQSGKIVQQQNDCSVKENTEGHDAETIL